MIILYGYADEILGETNGINKKSAESTAGRRLLDILLKENEIAAISEDIRIDASGRPYLEAGGIDFNITHSKGFVACALSLGEGRVGIDAEPSTRELPPERQKALATRFFSEDEQNALISGKKSFPKLWTEREAYLKMTGEGFSRGIGRAIPSEAHLVHFELCGFDVTVAAEQDCEIVLEEYKE